MKAHVIFGPPGTGKSTEIIHRMQEMLSTYGQDRIGLVSFTKAAAQELAKRTGIQPGGNISTIHSYAFRLAGILKDQVVDRSKLKEYSEICGIEISGANPEEQDQLSDGDFYLALYQLHHSRDLGSFDYEETYLNSDRPGELQQFIRFCEGLDNFKETYGYIDFNDMLKKAIDNPAPDLDILFVDEAQDLSPLQWRLIDHWSQSIPEVHIAGDDDQSIYVWGGANPQGMVEFRERYGADVVILEQSYRIPRSVHNLAQKTISNISKRVTKHYNPRDEEGSINWISDETNLSFKHGEDVLVLYRNHMLRENVEQRLISLGIPYAVDSGFPGVLHNFSANAIRTWHAMASDWENMGNITVSSHAIKNLIRNTKYVIRDLINNQEYQKLFDRYTWDSALMIKPEHFNYYRKIYDKYGNINVTPTIHLSSIHGSKGREADRVVLINGMSDRSLDAMQRDSDSEYRTFYVGITRARHQLDIVNSQNPLL